MSDRNHEVSITRPAELLGISRGSSYAAPRPVPDSDLKLMRRIDELYLAHPFLGARRRRDLLNREGFQVGRRHGSTLMARMGIEPLYPRPHPSRQHPAHPIYPSLLRGLTIDLANFVWAMDLTYVPMAKGFVSRCAVLDWASRFCPGAPGVDVLVAGRLQIAAQLVRREEKLRLEADICAVAGFWFGARWLRFSSWHLCPRLNLCMTTLHLNIRHDPGE